MKNKENNNLLKFCITVAIICVILLGIDWFLSDLVIVKICFAVALFLSLGGLYFYIFKSRNK